MEACKNFKTQEEKIYWTHFPSILFCQILSVGFDQQLVIPKKFADNLRKKLPEDVTIGGPSGAKWNVSIVTNEETLLFRQGWETFVEDNSLQEEDVLFFKYNGESHFDVLIFDGRSLCEREASYFVEKCDHEESNSGCQKKRNMREHSETMPESSKRARKDDNLTSLQSGQNNQGNERIRKRGNDAQPNNIKWNLRSREPPTCYVAQNVTPDAKMGSGVAYRVQYASNRRPITEEEKKNALQLARVASKEDSFIVVMRPTHVYKEFYMSIPSKWAISHLPHNSQMVTLRVKENSCVKEGVWQTKFCYRSYGCGLSGNWKKFSIENNLEEFDVCLFDLVNDTGNGLIMDVSIFRVVDEIIPLTRVGSTSERRGRPPKGQRRKHSTSGRRGRPLKDQRRNSEAMPASSKRSRKDDNLTSLQSGQNNQGNERIRKRGNDAQPNHIKWKLRSREPPT